MIYIVISNIILNFGEVSYLDASGFGELINAYTLTRKHKGRLVLINVSKKIMDLLVMTRMISIFKIFDNEQRAIDSFKS